MKILVCGKGGCGKSTISTLLAKEINRRGAQVLVIDTDESNFGLHSQLGMDRPQDFMDYFGGKKVLFKQVKTLQKGWKVNELPKQYLSEKENIKLLAIGKIYDFGEGCACPINALSSRFLEVIELEDDEFLIADTDAGIEHLGRGVDKGCDVILAVIDPCQESIKLAQKITEMAKAINKRFYYVLNKIDEETKEVLLKSVDKNKVIASISEDKRIFKNCLNGEELDFKVKEIGKLADFLEEDRKKEEK
jgi:CO dehydrogenase maturation factor